MHYHGTLVDGSVFDSSVMRGSPISFPLDGVIKGWTEGLQMMKVGAYRPLTNASLVAVRAHVSCLGLTSSRGQAQETRLCPWAEFLHTTRSRAVEKQCCS